MGDNSIGMINFLRLCELFDEEEAMKFACAVGNDIINVKMIEKLIYTNETKEQFKKRLINRIKLESLN